MADNEGMANASVVILHSGGLRSLVATALMLREHEPAQMNLLHLVDGRENAATRIEHLHRQAEYYQLRRVREVDVPHVFGHGQGKQPDGQPTGPLATAQQLLVGLAHARLHQIGRVLWPMACEGEAAAMARATEVMQLVNQLADLDPPPMPRLESPLLELNSQQVIELGAQLQVPWKLAWSCLHPGESPCRMCPACRRRKAAFTKAGLADPLDGAVTQPTE
ncbi:7-cyano-7-deazaguanine synthase [Phycisphaerales bacterium AB-hyl4]|uniref:7-cyano-7-deazaguanine synthase n=1 Tax=Natronomicrosphaera hydrolytica TaxID=3242702 RepID=A0ABV4U7I4_9BACT